MGVSFYIGSLVRGTGFDGQIGQAYIESGSTGIVLLILVSVFAISSSSRVAVTLQRRDIVVWRLAGVSERQARIVVLVEISFAATVGTLVGAACAFGLWPIWRLVLHAADMPYALTLGFPPLAVFPIVVFALTITAVLGGMKAGREAASVRPVLVLRSDSVAVRRFSWGSWLIGGLALCLIGYLLFFANRTSAHSSVIDITQKTTFIYMGTSLAYAVLIGSVGKFFVGRFLRVWTAVVPGRWSKSWFLASRQSEHDLELSTALVIPLTVSLVLVTGVFGYVGQAEDAARAFGVAFAGKGIDVGGLVQLLGLPVLISLINAGGIAIATGAKKRRDASMLFVLGATKRQLYSKLVFESVMLVGTSLLISLMVYFVNGLGFFVAVRYGPIPNASFIWPSFAPFSLALIGFGIFLVASVSTHLRLDYVQSTDIQ
ncbi:FtsX-like permease family protein [Trueperella bernardiae]|nr:MULTISPECIES: FtsX-like permease family protein [Actinomycetes]MDV6239162.1 FtsX-like permease family protein [Trueperella bernardiae]